MKTHEDRAIGRLFEIHGDYAKAYLTLTAKDDLRFEESGLERIGRVGQHVTIPCGFEKIVGRITKLATQDPTFELAKKSKLPVFPDFVRTIEISLLGMISGVGNKRLFEKGLRAYPSADDVVCAISKDELKLLFVGESGRDSLEVGSLVEDEDETVSIDTEKLFQNHFGLLGTTGSGKTCTLVHLIQSVLLKPEYKSSHFLVLDPHGEYGRAFDSEKYADDVLHRRIGGAPPSFSHLQSQRIDLPHYFFNFSEYKVLFRPAPQVQEPQLRDAIGKTRRQARDKTGTGSAEDDETLIADQPLPFEIRTLYGRLFGRNKKDEIAGWLGSLAYRIKVLSAQEELAFMFAPAEGPADFHAFRNLLLGFDESEKFHKVTILDLSSIPRVLNLLVIITNFLGRCIFDYMRGEEVERGTRHCLVVLEEAHNYVPRQFSVLDKNNEVDYTLGAFEAIAKEGRKYGVCVALSSQRPRDLSETLLSQCGTLFIHRLNNLYDKNIIQSAAAEVDSSLLDKMPILAKQACLVMGDAIKTSAEVRVASLASTPASESARIRTLWREDPKCPQLPPPEATADEADTIDNEAQGPVDGNVPF